MRYTGLNRRESRKCIYAKFNQKLLLKNAKTLNVGMSLPQPENGKNSAPINAETTITIQSIIQRGVKNMIEIYVQDSDMEVYIDMKLVEYARPGTMAHIIETILDRIVYSGETVSLYVRECGDMTLTKKFVKEWYMK